MSEEFVLPIVAAELTGLTVGGLAQLRYNGRGPRFYKPTPKKVLYKRSEIIAWIEASAQVQTGEPALVTR
ncbi:MULTISPECIES: AlpA family transcriptional regulator [unclassified Cryobacterium]|jgi:hypothetical protein|uniref:helix-turn-helix transcriptional regulator n=1 Tax=unclassified Cryobacterium TaxID=2649013 RepID=UPI000CE38BFA|nr:MULTISPECIES: hypothetical protein [unclassified Cryobacterium]TFD47619.1 hypothetical protein E3T46_17665 [Cryobacterium sp. Hh11]TFD56455.1 hypothetical protein E3T41_14720 [Cryobacterium sp. Hh38]